MENGGWGENGKVSKDKRGRMKGINSQGAEAPCKDEGQIRFPYFPSASDP